MLPCLNKQLFGLDCPGCGAQRAFLLIIKGEFSAAFQMYPAVYSILLLVLFLIVNLFLKFRHDWIFKFGLIIINVVVIAGAYIIKMSHVFN